MRIDSYRFLPRSFRSLYETWSPVGAAPPPVWAEFVPRLADASITLLSSGGLYLEPDQEPFDLDRERDQPTWGDPTMREIPDTVERVDVAHLHIDPGDILEDHEVALPNRALRRLADAGVLAGGTEHHVSVMGYQGRGDGSLDTWREETAPRIVERLRDQRSDGLVLAPV